MLPNSKIHKIRKTFKSRPSFRQKKNQKPFNLTAGRAIKCKMNFSLISFYYDDYDPIEFATFSAVN